MNVYNIHKIIGPKCERQRHRQPRNVLHDLAVSLSILAEYHTHTHAHVVDNSVPIFLSTRNGWENG